MGVIIVIIMVQMDRVEVFFSCLLLCSEKNGQMYSYLSLSYHNREGFRERECEGGGKRKRECVCERENGFIKFYN